MRHSTIILTLPNPGVDVSGGQDPARAEIEPDIADAECETRIITDGVHAERLGNAGICRLMSENKACRFAEDPK